MDVQYLSAQQLYDAEPRHAVTDGEKVERLSDAMLDGGWCGPALVATSYDGQHLYLLVGVHRHAALRRIAEHDKAPEHVPVIILDVRELDRAAVEVGYDTWADAQDSLQLADIVERAGYDDVADIIYDEGD